MSMYQQYRKQKKSTGGGAKFLAICFALVVLIGGIWYLSSVGKKVENTPTITTPISKSGSISDGWYVGKQVTIEGDIHTSSDPLAYSHTITLSGGETIAAMSSKIDLHNSQGHIFAQGQVVKFDGKKFIVDISVIGSSQDQLSSMTVPTAKDSKTFPELALKIDMANHSDISYSSSGEKIILHAEGFSDIMTVQGFRCESGFPEKDCDLIQKNFSGGSFINAGGMTFAQGANNTWFARNTAGIGYLITSPSDALIYKASSVLIPLNEGYIKSLSSSIEKLCDTKIVGQVSVQKETISSWKVQIKGANGMVCNVRIAFTNTGDEMSVINQTHGNQSTGTSIVVPKTTVSTGSVPAISASGFTYTSTRGGYAITFPSAKIAYYGVNVQENLGIDTLNCYIRLDIKDYKDKDIDTVGASVSIYECTSKTPAATLASKAPGYIFKTNKDGSKLFFIKSLNASWNDFTKKITIQ